MQSLLAASTNEDDVIERIEDVDSLKDNVFEDDAQNNFEIVTNTRSSIETDMIVLMDISCDKNWICCVHHSRDDGADDSQPAINVTLCPFEAYNVVTKEMEQVATANSPDDAVAISIPYATKAPSLPITEHYSEYQDHSKFLSISPDGKLIALSCYEKTDNKSGESSALKKGTPRCIIFEVKENSISLYTKLRNCNGRAVFLDRQNNEPCLAVINAETLEIYSNFSKSNKQPAHFFDLTPFGSSQRILRENIAHHESFIRENTSWVEIKCSNQNLYDIKKLMTLSRHIRHGVLVTPFVVNGIVRLWSIIDDGVRLTSFSAPNEHIIAFSKELKYAATITEGIRAVKIYNIKNGLLVYTLQSRFEDDDSLLEVTHARFCYESRYLALSGLQKTYNANGRCTTKAIFEVWYIEAEKSIYGIVQDTGEECVDKSKNVKPFVHRGVTNDGRKCLKGIYTHYNNKKSKLHCLELKIDEAFKNSDQVQITWLPGEIPHKNDEYEIENDIDDHKYLKCADIVVNNKSYVIRFGNRTIQLWKRGSPNASDGKRYQLVYIRAYKGPSYGLAYSFRDTWEIQNFDSIKFVNAEPIGRMIVNIMQSEDSLTEAEKIELKGVYHTEEIFLPILDDRTSANKFDYHTFESACQALHYLHSRWDLKPFKANISDQRSDEEDRIDKVKYMATLKNMKQEYRERAILQYNKNERFKKNLLNLFDKTYELIKKAMTEGKYENSNYFATMAGSRTLAMLANFVHGREIIKLLLKSEASIPFSIFSYSTSIRETSLAINNEEDRSILEVHPVLLRTIDRNNSFQTRTDVIDYRNSPKINQNIIGKLSSIAENENVLTVLIQELSYNLYKLMFNRILSDSKKIGPGCLSALADALLFLQEEGNTDLLLTSSQKLSYLAIDKFTLGILNSEMGEVLKVKDLQKEYVSNIRNLESHSTMEQMEKYKTNWWNIFNLLGYRLNLHIMYKSGKDSKWSKLKAAWKERVQLPYRRLFNVSKKDGPKNRTQICVVPLPYFNTYNILLEDRPKKKVISDHKSISWWKNALGDKREEIYKKKSAFVAVASDQNSNNIFRQGDTVLEVMLKYKWRKFLWTRFAGVCLVHAAYYITYCTGVLFALEMYGYDSASGNSSILDHPGHLISIIVMFLSGTVLLGQEMRQVYKSKKVIDYLSSGYNMVDIAAFVFPLVTFLQLVLNLDGYYELCSITTLILWLHGILRLRVFSFVGIALETIIQLSQKVWSILFILLLVIFAFTHSFMVLLRQQDDQFFQENYDGTTSLNSNNTPVDGEVPVNVGNTTLYDVSSSNGFKDPFKAFYQVWLFIFGVWDPITNGDAGDNRMIFVLCMLFALITVLIFTNMVIALMSSTVDEVKNKGNKVWVSHFAAVVAEIEQLWCFPSTKRNRNNNPSYIYYIANYDAVQRQEEKLEMETEELRKKVLGNGIDDKRAPEGSSHR